MPRTTEIGLLSFLLFLSAYDLCHAASRQDARPAARPAMLKSRSNSSSAKFEPLNSVSDDGKLLVPMKHFTINLDSEPEARWMEVAHHYREDLIAHVDNLIPALGSQHMEASHQWLGQVPFDQEYERELQGMVTHINHPTITLERMKWLNMLYEMDSPLWKPGCTGVLWATPNGTVMQGRNMDDLNIDPSHPVNNGKAYSSLLFDATLLKNGQPIIKMTQLPGRVGVAHGMRLGHNVLGGYAIAQNTREPNLWQQNLDAAGRGGQVHTMAIRKIMESTEDYNTAVDWLANIPFMAPHYFIVSGSGPNQGCVLTIDREANRVEGVPTITKLLLDDLMLVPNTKLVRKNNWFLVQTNDDINKSPEYDMRRPIANHMLSTTSQDITTTDNLLQFMHTTPMMNSGTVVTTVMVPRTGYYKSILPRDAPGIMDGNAIEYKLFEIEFLKKFPLPEEVPALQGSMRMWEEMNQPPAKEAPTRPPSLIQENATRALERDHDIGVKTRFLNRHHHSRKHLATAQVADELSFLQSSWRLET